MKAFERIRNQLAAGKFELSHHAHERAFEGNIGEREVRQAGIGASVIEEYPHDNYSPSCLLPGFTRTGGPLHIRGSLADTSSVRIVTPFRYYAEAGSLYVELKGEPGMEAHEVPYALDVDLVSAGHDVGFDIHHAPNRLDLSTLDVDALPLRSHKVG